MGVDDLLGGLFQSDTLWFATRQQGMFDLRSRGLNDSCITQQYNHAMDVQCQMDQQRLHDQYRLRQQQMSVVGNILMQDCTAVTGLNPWGYYNPFDAMNRYAIASTEDAAERKWNEWKAAVAKCRPFLVKPSWFRRLLSFLVSA